MTLQEVAYQVSSRALRLIRRPILQAIKVEAIDEVASVANSKLPKVGYHTDKQTNN